MNTKRIIFGLIFATIVFALIILACDMGGDTDPIYMVIYDSNNGTGETTSQTLTYGETKQLRLNTFYYEGYGFAGWALKDDPETYARYEDGESVINLTTGASITLYARWVRLMTYIIVFHSNNGADPEETVIQTIVYGTFQDLKTIASLEFTAPIGLSFAGWAEDPEGDVKYNNGESVRNLTTEVSIDLYARWGYIVTFDPDDGSTALTEQVVVRDDNAPKPTDPVKSFTIVEGLYEGTVTDSYKLDGWYKGSEKWDFDLDTVTENITLKAKWLDPVINVSLQSGNNFIEMAIAYANANPKTYTLIVGNDYSIMPQILDRSSLRLTIIGLGATERKISLFMRGVLFTIGASGQTNIELCLGNNITLTGFSSNSSNSLVKIENNATFTMLEGSKIAENISNGNGGGVFIGDTGNFTLDGGIIMNNKGAAGGGVYNTGSFTIIKGTILHNECGNEYQYGLRSGGGVYSEGNFTMIGGDITNNHTNVSMDSYGGGVCISGGTFTMSGGNIINNDTSEGYSSCGGGVYIHDGSFIMSGGAISGNHVSQGSGGGVYNESLFTLKGGTISNNFVGEEGSTDIGGDGGGVCNAGTFIMDSGNITGNYTASDSLYCMGGGVDNWGTFTMNGGYITGNTSLYGCGVYNGGNFTITGGYIISNIGECGDDLPYYIRAAGIGVYSAWGNFVMDGGYITGNIVSNNNMSGYSGGGVYLDSGYFTMNKGEISDNDQGCYIAGGTFVMNGGEISDNDNGCYIADGTFVMNGGSILRNYNCGVVIGEYGAFEMYEKAAVSYNTGYYNDHKLSPPGAGVVNSGNFTMYGGTISHNTTGNNKQDGGGGVLNDNTFIMYGGTISENWARHNGGGVWSHFEGAVFTMYGGEICKNYDDGVCISDSVFTMYGGIICKNDGDGVGISDSVFTIEDGIIQSNAYCGVYCDGTFIMKAGEIMDNGYGGIYCKGTFIMNGGKIYRNTTEWRGGGVYFETMLYDEDSGIFNKTGGTIQGYSPADPDSNVVKDGSGNILTNAGHAVYARSDDDTVIKRQEDTVGPTINLFFDGETGESSGWQY